MTMQKSILFLMCVLALPFASAQQAERKLEAFAQHGQRLELTTNDGKYTITPFSDTIIETAFVPKGESYPPRSHAVVLAPQKLKVRLDASDTTIAYSTPGIAVVVTRAPFNIAYTYKGKPLIAEQRGYYRKAGSDVIDFTLEASEALYGGGARALGMNRRGHRLALYNKAHYGYEQRSELLNYTMPLVLSSKKYMIHFDNATIGHLDLDSGKNNVLAYEVDSGRKTYQVIAGDSWESLAASYTGLTGRQPLPPRWALGNFASRFGYRSEAHARATVEKFEADKIPLDAIIFDLFWFGKDIKGTMGNLAFDQDTFPNPKKMVADFAAKNIKTILITEPFVLTTSKRWQEAVDKKVLVSDGAGKPFTYDFYFGNTGLIDIFEPKARDWFWNIHKDLVQQGVGGWWGDLGEPEVHPAGMHHATGTAAQVHNIYGHDWARMMYEGYRKDFPTQRPFILMRAGYSGSQRFGLIPWSGDVNRSWGGLQSQTEISLQMGMQGLAYMHSDLGGFAGANPDDELYVRWLQYGVFQPVFRPHAQDEVQPEPVYRAPATMALAREAIRLRYRMLPYNYTAAFENQQSGMPLMRPLMYEEPDNPKLLAVSDTYLWGKDFLVSPVVSPKLASKEIYFPGKDAWFDFYTDQRHAAGSTSTMALKPEHIPVFVRAGAFIPMAPEMQNTAQYSSSKLILHYYHDEAVASASGKLYDDDGSTPEAFEKGQYELLTFTGKRRGATLELSIASEAGRRHVRPARSVALIVHNVGARPASAMLDGKEVAFAWDAERRLLTLEMPASKRARRILLIDLKA
jgi:oligosaccharide 4-alpha-D-glucosyltransferase